MGNIQLLDPESNNLYIVAQVGFKDDFLKHFEIVKAFDNSACGRAFGISTPIIINDVTLDKAFAPHLKIAKSAGLRAVKSVPLITSDNKGLGVISTHFREPKYNWDTNKLNSIIP